MDSLFFQITPGGKKITYDHPVIMGILNVTDDSFYDGGKYRNLDEALRHTEKMVRDGAEIIDIGGESTRPGADPVSVEEELDRVLPVLEAIKKNIDVVISVDTYKSAVAEEALKLGADIINDISGFTFDDNMVNVIKKYNAIAIAMHIKGKPKDMQKNPQYRNVKKEVFNFLKNSIRRALKAGIKRDKLIIDPGIGFGKKLTHNIEIIRNLSYFKRFELPILIGVSRKSMIGMILGDTQEMNEMVKPPSERLNGTIAVNVLSYLKGANIFRVHDVKENFEALKVAHQILFREV